MKVVNEDNQKADKESWNVWNIHAASEEEWKPAMDLAWRTFLRFEAGDYTNEGINNFHEFVRDERLYNLFMNGYYRLFVAERKDQVVGMISQRDEKHISLLFVDPDYHKLGVGKALITYLADYLKRNGIQHMTVNAAPYGVEFYHKVGFVDTGSEMEKDGIRYTPMVYQPTL